MNDLFTLLTRLTRRLGSKSCRLKCIWSVSSSAYVQHSRGEFDQILQWFMINPASIWSKLSLGCRGVTKNSGFFSKTAKFLYDSIKSYFTKRKNTGSHKKIMQKSQIVWFEEEWTAAIARWSWAMIPQSCKYHLPNLDRRLQVLPRVAPRFRMRHLIRDQRLITCNLNMIKHDYSCNLRHKTLHLCACYHTLSAFLSFYAYLCLNLKIH